MSDLGPLARWRLVLGEAADTCMGGALDAQGQAMDAALSWLYDRDESLGERDVASRQGGSGASVLSVPDWISEVHRLFPQETIERLEQDAIERYQIEELVTRADVLERVQPSEVLLQAVLRTKHLMNPEVLALARKLVAEVVRHYGDDLSQRSLHPTVTRQFRSPRSSGRDRPSPPPAPPPAAC